MNIKRPIILFVISAIIGIVVAYDDVVISFKIIVVVTAIFLLLNLYIKHKFKFQYIIILLSILLGFSIRYKAEALMYDKCDKMIDGLQNNTLTLQGKIKNIGSSKNSNYLILENIYVNRQFIKKIKLYYSKDENYDVKIGNIVKVKSNIYKNAKPQNEGEFNNLLYNRSNGIFFQGYIRDLEVENKEIDILRNFLYNVKKDFHKKINLIFVDIDAGLFYAMLVGDKSEINPIRKKLFDENGIAHILAISGLHLSILGICLFELLRKRFSLNKSAIFVSIFIFLYGLLIDASTITLRAIIMLYIRFLSLAIGRTYDSKNILYLLCFIFLFYKPYLLFNAGFQFSYVSIFALNTDYIIKFKDSDERIIIKKIPPILILTLFLMPITLYHYYSYPLYSIFLNILVIPLMTFVITFGIVGVCFSYFSILLGRFFVGIVHFIFMFYEKICLFIQKLPYNNLAIGKPFIFKIFIFYMVLLFVWYLFRNEKKFMKISNIKFSLYSLLFSIFVLCFSIRKDYRMTFLSIGQGDGIIIENNNRYFSIDCGSTSTKTSGEYILEPHLKSRGITIIDTAFITHADSDHTNAILYVMDNKNIKFNSLILPIMAKNNQKYDIIKKVASDNNVSIEYKKAGDRIIFSKDLRVDIMNPLEYDNNMIEDINEQSLVFKVVYKNKSTLFTGDIGKITEEKILNNNTFKNILKSDVLKVSHHGSKNSSLDEFIKYSSPTYSIISYGKDNKYGHPHKETLETLKKYDSKIFLTGEMGQVDVFFENGNVKIKTFK